jgi:hypothetical protein
LQKFGHTNRPWLFLTSYFLKTFLDLSDM